MLTASSVSHAVSSPDWEPIKDELGRAVSMLTSEVTGSLHHVHNRNLFFLTIKPKGFTYMLIFTDISFPFLHSC